MEGNFVFAIGPRYGALLVRLSIPTTKITTEIIAKLKRNNKGRLIF